jgi:hypothetical protein
MTSVNVKIDATDANEMAHICDDMRGQTDEEIHVVIMAYLNSSDRLYRRAMQQQHSKPTFRVINGGKE